VSVAAYQADGRPIAPEAFYARACDPRRSVVIEACAGSGKTWMLVSRILRALLEGAQPHEILAITFTRKAAGEMRERLNDWLREFGAPACADATRIAALRQRGLSFADAQRLAPALGGLHEQLLSRGRPIEICTFHAWFAQLLRAAPFELLDELGLQPGMTLIEDLDDHRAEVFRRFHAALLRDPERRADHAALIAQRGRSQIASWLEAALDKRIEIELADAAGVLEASVPGPDGAGGPGDAAIDATDRALADLARELGQRKGRAQDAAAGLLAALADADARACFERAWAALFTREGTPRRQLGSAPSLPSVQADLEALARRVQQHDARIEHLRMVGLARVLLAEFATYKRERSLADMADLERCGLALLRDVTLAGWVQERLDARIRHVLIDEFQDTSPLQWHALHAWLVAYAGAGGGASGQRPPAVFIVGDPKQSIYRFRGAEPRVFEAARRFVVDELGGTLLGCDHTRRNAPALLATFNALFGAAAAQGEFDGFRPHTTEAGDAPGAGVYALAAVDRPARPERAGAKPVAPWRDTLTTPRHEPEEVLRAQEARRVARAIRDLLASHPQWRPGDVYVLSRKRESLRLVAQALREVHLPFAAVEEAPLLEAAEARDLIALLDALVSPGHALSLAHALRSPLFGASDADLIELARRSRNGDWWRALLEADPPPSPALQRARDLLVRWQAAALELPPHDLLDRIVAEGELRERVAATVPAEQRAAALDAIDAVLAQALQLDGARYATPYNFVRALKRRTIKFTAPAHPDAVQLLTVHGAKGLEAEAVFVVDADPQPANAQTTTLLIDWPVEAGGPRRCAFVYSEAACPPSLQPLLDAELRARQREELNGLYVAMSRARQQLVFSSTEPQWRGPAPSWWQRVAGLATAWPYGDAPSRRAADLPIVPAPTLRRLPTLPVRPSIDARPVPRSDDSDASRLGQAVHRVLEWCGSRSGLADDELAHLAGAAALEFGAPLAATARCAAAILRSPQCRRFYGGDQLRWAGNEVQIALAGEPVRIDRLVLIDEGQDAVWWVLDYKLHHAPHELESYRGQLRGYRDAVRAAQPGSVVRCAFVTGTGEVIEVG
jgi:ATP-dependent helicase/nuclease subunit A